MYKSKLEEKIPEIIELYNSGLSCSEIAKRFNCNRSTILYQLKNRGISLRSKKGIKHCVNPKRNVQTEFFTDKEGTQSLIIF